MSLYSHWLEFTKRGQQIGDSFRYDLNSSCTSGSAGRRCCIPQRTANRRTRRVETNRPHATPVRYAGIAITFAHVRLERATGEVLDNRSASLRAPPKSRSQPRSSLAIHSPPGKPGIHSCCPRKAPRGIRKMHGVAAPVASYSGSPAWRIDSPRVASV